MCNSYESRFNVTEVVKEFDLLGLALVAAPARAAGERRRPTDPAPIIRPAEGGIEIVERRWGFAPPRPKAGPVTNWRADARRFDAGRCLIPATAFHEFTGDRYPKTMWRFTMAGASWFCIAGIWRPGADGTEERFTMLTIPPGPDVVEIHDRQPAILTRDRWARWLAAEPVPTGWLEPLPAGSLVVEMARPGRDG